MQATTAKITHGYLDDPKSWLEPQSFDAPDSVEDIAGVQKEIDSIVGTTRDNKSICKLVWNGDRKYWKEYFDDWDPYGRPVGGIQRRPWVLYKSIFDARDKFVRDAFVPRYLVLTRLEPEQYADAWEQNCFFYEPTRARHVQFRPSEPPKEWHLWYMTIAEHRGGCCQIAAQNEAECYGLYAHPRKCLELLRADRRGMEQSGIQENRPFDAPDAVAMRIRDNMHSNYAQQAMEKYNTKASFLLDEAPLTIAGNKLIEEAASRAKIRSAVSEALKRGADNLERKLKERGAI